MSVQSARSLVHSESGIALLGTVLVAALVLGLATWGVLNITSNAQQTVYRENAANQARTAALMGIQAVTGYAQSIYVGKTPLPTSPLKSPNGIVDQSFTQPTNANVQAMIVANTFSGAASTGYIKMLSTGRSGSAIQTAEAYLTAQMSTLYNNKYSVILGGTATLRGAVQNDTEPKHKHKIYVGEGPGSNITVSGNTTDKTVVYSHASSLPIINPDGLEQYATILLVNGIVTIPEGAVSFYIANNFLPKSTPLTSSYSCSASSCPASLLITYQSTSPATWSIGNIPAFIYSNQDVNVTSTVTLQLTVASTGNIATGNGVTIYPFGSLSSTIYSTTNYCNLYGELPICNNQVDPAIPYSSVQGVIYVVSGSNNVGTSDKFYGDVASIGELSVSGSGGDRFGGAIIAEGGYTGTKGILKILNPVASADSATLGGYQLTASSIRWVP